MKKLFVLFIIGASMFLISPTYAASDWSLLSSGDVNSLRAITSSGDNLVAAGNGKIVYSKDNGKTWIKSFETTGVTFFDLATMPNGDLLAVGSIGINEISSDNGKTWSVFSFGITQNIYGIDVKTISGSSTGYLVGANGTYRNYASATGNWDEKSLEISTDLYGVVDIGNNTGFIVGADGKIYKLVLGGTSWVSVESGTKETLRAIKFVSSTKGFVVGSMGTVLKTVDGGTTWNPVVISGIANQLLTDIDVSGNNIVITGEKVLISSNDGGDTWVVKSFDQTQKKFYGAFAKDSANIFAVGTDDDVKSLVYQLTQEVATAVPVVVEAPTGAAPVASVSEVSQSSLIKLSCSANATVNDPCKAVYYYATDGKRHAFPNDKVYFSWFTDFNTVQEVSSSFLSSLPLGKNVTYRPGVKMVKFQSMNTVFAVAKGGTLRSIASESVAAALYGNDWNKKIDDISDAFFGNYKFGDVINSASDYDPVATRVLVGSISENF